jgi:hypothetical protein
VSIVNVVPAGCDLRLVADELREMMLKKEMGAQEQGGHFCYSAEFVTRVETFLADPSHEAALRLLLVAPKLRRFFEACSPGGPLYSLKRTG